MAYDPFSATQTVQADSVITPALEWFAVTPSDTVELKTLPKAVIVTGTGNLAVKSVNGNTAIFPMTPGVPLPIRPRFILATGTTATGIIGLV